MKKQENKRELLFSITDLRIEYFSGRGAGGQHRNKHQNCVRLHHDESGVIVTGQSHKSRKANRREALNNLVKHPKFKLWHSRKVYEILRGKKLEKEVEEMLKPENLKIEIRVNNKWEEVTQ